MDDVIIIGGGYAGLSAAALLSHRGLRVHLLEQSRSLGGRAAFEEKDGFLLDYGIHSHRLGENGPLARVFRELGEPLRFTDSRRVDSYLFQEGKLVRIPETVAGFLSTPILSRAEKLRFFSTLLRMMPARIERWYSRNLSEFLDFPPESPGLRTMSTLLSLAIMAPHSGDASAGEVIDIFRRAVFSRRKVGDPAGGAGQIIGTLVKIIRRTGRISLETEVSGFDFAGDRIRAAVTPKSRFPARAFIYAGPLPELPRLLPQARFPVPVLEYIRNLVPTSGLSLEFGLRKKITGIKGAIFTLNPIIIGRFPSNPDPLRAPAGRQLSTWLFPLPYPVNRKNLEAAETAIRGTIPDIFPEFFGAVEWERKLVHPVMDGVHLRPDQSRPFRPPVDPGISSNLFLAGDAVGGRGSGGDIAFSSALEASIEIEKYFRNIK